MQGKNNKKEYSLIKILKCDYCKSDNHIPILKSKDYVHNVIPGEFTLVKCLNCKLVFTNPRLKRDDLIRYYSKIIRYGEPPIKGYEKTNSFLSNRKNILTDYFNYPFLEKNFKRKLIHLPNYLHLRRWWKKTLYIPPYIEDGSILEVGCSYGSHLFTLKSLGWRVKGIELNEDAINYTRNVLNLDVEKTRIEDFHSDTLYNIIYLYMVLEHLESPKAILKKLFLLLKPKGILVFSIPDFSGIEVKLYKKYARSIHVPYHLYHFTPTTIKNYLSEYKFKKVKFIHQNYDIDLISPLNFILKENPNKIFIKISKQVCESKLVRRTILRLIIRILAYLGMTSRMTIIAKK